MITGFDEVKIKRFFWADDEGAPSEPASGGEFVGIPHGFCGEGSEPFIEHRVDGKIFASYNLRRIDIIEFDVEENA